MPPGKFTSVRPHFYRIVQLVQTARLLKAETDEHTLFTSLLCLQFGAIDIDSELVAKTEVLEGSADSVVTLANGGCLDDILCKLPQGHGFAWGSQPNGHA